MFYNSRLINPIHSSKTCMYPHLAISLTILKYIFNFHIIHILGLSVVSVYWSYLKSNYCKDFVLIVFLFLQLLMLVTFFPSTPDYKLAIPSSTLSNPSFTQLETFSKNLILLLLSNISIFILYIISISSHLICVQTHYSHIITWFCTSRCLVLDWQFIMMLKDQKFPYLPASQTKFLSMWATVMIHARAVTLSTGSSSVLCKPEAIKILPIQIAVNKELWNCPCITSLMVPSRLYLSFTKTC